MRKTLFVALLFAAYCAKAHQQKPTTLTTNHTNKTIATLSCKTQKLYVVASNKGSISLWDANTGHMKANMVVPNGLTVQEVQYNEAENYVVAVCYKTLNDAQLFIWQPNEDEGKFIRLSKTKKVSDIRLCNDNVNILVSYTDNSVEYIALATMQVIMQISPKETAVNLKEIIINKSLNLVVVPHTNGLCVYNLGAKILVKELNVEAEKIAFSPDGEKILLIAKKQLYVYSTESWELLSIKNLP